MNDYSDAFVLTQCLDRASVMPAARTRPANWRTCCIMTAVAWLFAAGSAPVQSATQEVVFRVGDNASIDWFEIDNPLVHGTLNVTNAPYDNTTNLNAAAVDVGRNRLIFDTQSTNPSQGYAINNLTNLQLIQNGATPVTVTALGTWPDGSTNAGYRKTDGQVYYHPDDGSIQLRQLDFDSSGQISGFKNIGSFNGPTAISGGDIDFSVDGSSWVSGNNSNGNPRLWNFDSATLNAITTLTTSDLYNGITFNAAGDTLYGYQGATGQYGIIDRTTGAFQTVLETNTTFFGVTGDLATGTANITIVPPPTPEPSSLCLFGAGAIGFAFAARWRRRQRQ